MLGASGDSGHGLRGAADGAGDEGERHGDAREQAEVEHRAAAEKRVWQTKSEELLGELSSERHESLGGHRGRESVAPYRRGGGLLCNFVQIQAQRVGRRRNSSRSQQPPNVRRKVLDSGSRDTACASCEGTTEPQGTTLQPRPTRLAHALWR